MKTRLFLILASLVVMGGCKKSSSSSAAASSSGFTQNVNAIASTTPDNTEPGSVDGFPLDTTDTSEPSTVS